jgi:hypothetical protein
MKKILFLIPSLMLLMTSCEWFKQDNYEPYNASITGSFKDSSTGTNVEQECIYNNAYGGNISVNTTGYISAYELGWDFQAAQAWLIKYDGTYTNSQIFAGTYRLEAKENNFYPVIQDNVIINKGSNTVDWTVTPYVRIIDPVIIFDATVNKFKATFKCQYGDASKANTIFKAMFCAYPDVFVGAFLNYCATDPEASATTTIVANGTTVNTLYINPANAGNINEFKYSRMHYFRIAVCATGTGANTSKMYNYSPKVGIQY